MDFAAQFEAYIATNNIKPLFKKTLSLGNKGYGYAIEQLSGDSVKLHVLMEGYKPMINTFPTVEGAFDYLCELKKEIAGASGDSPAPAGGSSSGLCGSADNMTRLMDKLTDIVGAQQENNRQMNEQIVVMSRQQNQMNENLIQSQKEQTQNFALMTQSLVDSGTRSEERMIAYMDRQDKNHEAALSRQEAMNNALLESQRQQAVAFDGINQRMIEASGRQQQRMLEYMNRNDDRFGQIVQAQAETTQRMIESETARGEFFERMNNSMLTANRHNSEQLMNFVKENEQNRSKALEDEKKAIRDRNQAEKDQEGCAIM